MPRKMTQANMAKPRGIFVFLLTCMMFAVSARCFAQHSRSAMLQQASKERVIIDTDIGDDVDDAFAVALALRSSELQILGITTTFGDTNDRAKLADRLLGEAGRQDITVAAGTPTPPVGQFTQRAYADGGHFARA